MHRITKEREPVTLGLLYGLLLYKVFTWHVGLNYEFSTDNRPYIAGLEGRGVGKQTEDRYRWTGRKTLLLLCSVLARVVFEKVLLVVEPEPFLDAIAVTAVSQ